MNDQSPNQTTDYRSFLVRFERDSADCEWRIYVRGVSDDTHRRVETIMELATFLTLETGTEMAA